jgi:hypothetical protein
MDQLPFSSTAIQQALDYLASNPWVYPALVDQAVTNAGGIGPFVARRVPDGDPAQVDRELALVYVCRQLCRRGLGWVPYTPLAVVTTTT